MKKVIFFEVDKSEEEFFQDHLGSKADLEFYKDRLLQDDVDNAKEADIVVCFVYSDLSTRIIDNVRNLKGIATMSVGTDHIDLVEATKKHIVVSNVPSYGPQTVAEHALALLLTISRNIIESVERTKHGEYDYMGLKGIDLSGKTIGIIGTGKIGSLVARMAYGLNMKILASDEHQNPELAEKWGLKYVDMPELFKNSDVISLHVPMCPKNKYLLDEEQFKQIKRGAILINTARGGLINPEALIKALDDGTIYRAGIDVLEDEGLLKEERELFSPYFKIKDYQLALADHVLMKHPSVIVTPHNAFNSVESHKNILRTTVANIEGMLEGEPINVVND